MTTEILRNLLYNKKIKTNKLQLTIEIDIYADVSAIIFDEVHYITNKDRGRVWEESIILLPQHIQLIMLSATIEQPQLFGNWINSIKTLDTTLTITDKRIVPLKHYLFISFLHKIGKEYREDESSIHLYDKKLICIMDENKNLDSITYDKVNNLKKKYFKFISRKAIFNDLIQFLKHKNLLPTIIFTLSKKKCESYSKLVTAQINDTLEQSEALSVFDKELRKSDNYNELIKMDDYNTIKNLVQKGIAYHHSGVYHVFKEVIEKMLAYKDIYGVSKSLIKVLFATETFAVGINIPVKATCYTGLTKFSENNFRLLKPHEYKQMSGRAGRRGMDTEGYSILLPNLYDLPSSSEITELLTGKNQILYSRFVPNFQFILKLILTGNNQIMSFIKSSLLNKEIVEEEVYINEEINKLQIPQKDYSKCIEYDSLMDPNMDSFIKLSQKTIKKNKKLADKIKNGVNFKSLYEDYTVDKDTIQYKDTLIASLSENSSYIHQCITKILTILQDNLYISETSNINEYDTILPCNISIKGIIAGQINECNEILFTEIITNDYLDNLNEEEIVAILSLFIQSKQDDDISIESLEVPQKIKTNISSILEIGTKFENTMSSNKLYINIDWDLSINSVDYMYKWCQGADFNVLIKKYKLYPGNFVKDVIKVNNIVQDIMKIGELLGKHKLLSVVSNIENKLIRDCVNMESLYVKI